MTRADSPQHELHGGPTLANGAPAEIESVCNGTTSIHAVAKQTKSKGHKIKLLKGQTPSVLAREGIAYLREGLPVREIVTAIGMTLDAFAKVRDIVLLSERDDLNASDAAIVRNALRDLDQTQSLRSWSKVQPIARRIWGRKGHRLKTDKRRADRFDNAISFLANACDGAVDIDIPNLHGHTARAAIQRLNQAQKALEQLKVRIRKEGGAHE